MCGRCCKIWRIDEVLEKVDAGADAGDDFIYLVNRLAAMQLEDDRKF